MDTMKDSGGDVRDVIIPLWKRFDEVLIPLLQVLKRDTKIPGNYGVLAVLPGQELDFETYSALEAAGLLTIEVPESLRDAHCSMIAEYLTKVLADGSMATAARLATQSLPGEDEEGGDQPLTEEEAEEELLKHINDPRNAI